MIYPKMSINRGNEKGIQQYENYDGGLDKDERENKFEKEKGKNER